jgi:hypothetical protein
MRTESILKKAVAGLGSAALVIAMSACAHHDVAADQGYGQIRTEAPATADNSGATVATVPAPVNTEGVATSPTPAVISGPAAVDNSGRAYTSSSAGGTGNGSAVGTNTNVNLIPKKTSSDVIVTQSPATIETTETTVITPAPAPVIVETPAPAPVIVETPAPAPVIVETPAPMSSSTTETQTTTTDTTTTTTDTTAKTTTKHHRRMHKD